MEEEKKSEKKRSTSIRHFELDLRVNVACILLPLVFEESNLFLAQEEEVGEVSVEGMEGVRARGEDLRSPVLQAQS